MTIKVSIQYKENGIICVQLFVPRFAFGHLTNFRYIFFHRLKWHQHIFCNVFSIKFSQISGAGKLLNKCKDSFVLAPVHVFCQVLLVLDPSA